MGTLANLLRWKKEVKLKDESGKEIKTVYMRVLGDYDINEAFRHARLISSALRSSLRDIESDMYKDATAPFEEASAEDCKDVIRASRSVNWSSEARSIIVRPEELSLADFALDPDAPSLEEQEKLDIAEAQSNLDYTTKISEYLSTRTAELDAELDSKSIEELRELARIEISNLLPLTAFISEVQDQKVARSVYEDGAMTIKGFDSVQDFKEAHPFIRQQLIDAYTNLEINPETLKN